MEEITGAEVTVEHHSAVVVVTMHNPVSRNAFTTALSGELAAAVEQAQADESVHALVVTGSPPYFCGGADLRDLSAAQEPGLRALYAGCLAVVNCTLPTIAAVAGPAVGAGLNLALATDVRLATAAARFDARYLELGLHPGGGMTWMLQQALGQQRATAMTLFGEVLDAEAALRAGLVHRVVDGDAAAVVSAAVALAQRTAEVPRDLLITTKRTIRTTRTLRTHGAAVDAEMTPQLVSLDSAEFTDRMAAVKAQYGTSPGACPNVVRQRRNSSAP